MWPAPSTLRVWLLKPTFGTPQALTLSPGVKCTFQKPPPLPVPPLPLLPLPLVPPLSPPLPLLPLPLVAPPSPPLPLLPLPLSAVVWVVPSLKCPTPTNCFVCPTLIVACAAPSAVTVSIDTSTASTCNVVCDDPVAPDESVARNVT